MRGQWPDIFLLSSTSGPEGLIVSLALPQTDIYARAGVLFFSIMNQGMSPLIGIVHTFPAEQAVVSREWFNGLYTISAYFWSKSIIEIPFMVL